jgi:hypothetical protein
MKRREFVKTIPLTALLPTGLSALAGSAQAASSAESGNTSGQASPEAFG